MRIKNNGFVALMSSIIISVILLLLIATTSLTGFYGRTNVSEYEFKEKSAALAEACVNYAILQLTIDGSYAGNESIPVGDAGCQIRPIAISGANKIIETQAIYQDSYTNLRVVANTATLSVVSYDEVSTF